MDKSYRNLVREVARSEYLVRDQNSILGLLWSFLNPLLMMILLFAYFRTNAGRGVDHYGVFLLLGMVHYTHFSNSTSVAMNVLTSMAQLTRHTILPKEVLVIGSVLATSIDFIVSMVFCLLLAYFSGVPVSWAIVGLPLIVVLQLVFVTWVALLLASARVFIKDLSHIYQVLLRLLFFATPIFYTRAFVKNSFAQQLVALNPLAKLIELSRAAVMDGHIFPAKTLLVFAAINVFLLWAAFRCFKRFEPSFAEYA